MTFHAQAGRGDELAGVLVEVGEGLRAVAGCERWVVARVVDEPDVVVVDELWDDRTTMEAAALSAGHDERFGRIMGLLDPERPPQRQELEPVGGAGVLPPPAAGTTRLPLDEAEDMAATMGFGAQGASRFPARALGLERTGLALHTMPPDAVSAFGHRHANAEEVYVVLGGAGTLHAGGEAIALRARDAVRVAPTVDRGFAAGPEGLEVLAVGPRHPGDGEVLRGWTPEGA